MGLPKQTGLKVANIHLEMIGATKANEEKEEEPKEVCSSRLKMSFSKCDFSWLQAPTFPEKQASIFFLSAGSIGNLTGVMSH